MKTIEIYMADIRELTHREAELLPLLPPERRAEAEHIRPEADRLHCIAAGLLLRYVLGVTADGDLYRNEFGKPELTGEGPCFNLSHGGNYAVLALSDSAVGIDVEPVGEGIPITIPRRYLQSDELAWLEERQTPERFARLWTRLESALKADGRGFALANRKFSVLESGNPWYLETLLHNGHCISCASGVPFEPELKLLSAEVLLTGKKP